MGIKQLLDNHHPLMRARTLDGCPINTLKSLNDEIGLQLVQELTWDVVAHQQPPNGYLLVFQGEHITIAFGQGQN